MSGAVPRVGVNLLWLVPGVVGGSEEYTVRLLHAVGERLGSSMEVVLFVNRLLPDAHPGLVNRHRTVVAPLRGDRKALRVTAETTWLAAAARSHRVGLLHHMGGILPLVRSVPAVVTIHDLQPLAMPEHFHPVKRRFHRLALPWAARHAERIVTLTDHTRRDLELRLGVDPSRVVLAPPGVQPGDPTAPAQVEAVRRRYGLGGDPYFIYPAITYPHKNHRLLIDALADVVRDHPSARLVLTHRAAQCETPLAEQARDLGLLENIVRTGRVPAADLDALYDGAVALTFPSQFEGFGLPVLEAMARGCPVVASSATALPEVVGEGGLLLDPADPQEWARTMVTLIDDEDRRRDLARRGRARAASFRWETSADAVIDLWSDLLGERGVDP